MKKDNTTNKKNTLISKGVYLTPKGTYVVRPTVDGKRLYVKFTNKAKAIKFQKNSLV